MCALFLAKVASYRAHDVREVLNRCRSQLWVEPFRDHLAALGRHRLRDSLAIFNAHQPVCELPRRLEVDLDPPLAVPLAEVKGVTVDHPLPLLRRERRHPPRGDFDLRGEPRRDHGFFGVVLLSELVIDRIIQ